MPLLIYFLFFVLNFMLSACRTDFAAVFRTALSSEQICIREAVEKGGLCISICNLKTYLRGGGGSVSRGSITQPQTK